MDDSVNDTGKKQDRNRKRRDEKIFGIAAGKHSYCQIKSRLEWVSG